MGAPWGSGSKPSASSFGGPGSRGGAPRPAPKPAPKPVMSPELQRFLASLAPKKPVPVPSKKPVPVVPSRPSPAALGGPPNTQKGGVRLQPVQPKPPPAPKPAQIGPGGQQLHVDRFGRAHGLDSDYNPHDLVADGSLQDMVYYPHFDQTGVVAEPWRPDPNGAKPPVAYLGNRSNRIAGPVAIPQPAPAPTFSPAELLRAAVSGAATAPAAQAVQQPAPAPEPARIAGPVAIVPAPAPAPLWGSGEAGTGRVPDGHQINPTADRWGSGGTATGRVPGGFEVTPVVEPERIAGPVAIVPPAPAPTFTPEDLLRAAVTGSASAPAAQAIQQPAPASAPTVPDVVPHPKADPNFVPTTAAPVAPPAPAVVSPPPPPNDAAVTGPVGMWTDPNNGGQMPAPADQPTWDAIRRVVDSEFGPDQSIYNPTYDEERFPTYDPMDTVAPFARSGSGGGGGQGGTSSGGASAVNSDVVVGGDDYTGSQFGGHGGDAAALKRALAVLGFQSGELTQQQMDAQWDLDEKYEALYRALPGMFNRRGMLDSGLYDRGWDRTAAYETEEQNRLDRRFDSLANQLNLGEWNAESDYALGGLEGLINNAAALAASSADIAGSTGGAPVSIDPSAGGSVEAVNPNTGLTASQALSFLNTPAALGPAPTAAATRVAAFNDAFNESYGGLSPAAQAAKKADLDRLFAGIAARRG